MDLKNLLFLKQPNSNIQNSKNLKFFFLSILFKCLINSWVAWIGFRVSNKVFVPRDIRYKYIRISSRDRTNIIFSILISDRRIPDHLLMDKVFASIFTGYPKISDIHIQISILIALKFQPILKMKQTYSGCEP